jgi:hypothetical protein
MTLKPGSQKLYIRRGDPLEVVIGPSLLNGVAEVIADVNAILCQVRLDEDDAALVLDLAPFAALSSGGTVCTITLAGTDTDDLTPGDYKWDFQPGPNSETWVEGDVEIARDYSRDLA